MKAITDRRSIRKYKDIPLEEEKINDILRAALLAPSAKNRQPWKFIVYQGEAKKRLVAAMEKGIKREQSGITDLPGFAYGLPDAAHTLEIMKAVPVLVAVLNTNGGTFYEIGAEQRIVESCDSLSIGAAVENMLLRATELGVGSLWIANTCFAYNELVQEIGTKDQLTGVVALGYGDEAPAPRPRKAWDDVVEYRS
jgi:nitroreductase